jgi:oxygen-dependent protoporphyrinogen oxidase
VYEKNVVGGKAHTVKKDNFLFEEGVNGFLSSVPETLELCEDIGIKSIEANQNSKIRYIYDDKLYKLPNGALGFVFGDILPWSAKIRMFGEFFVKPQPKDDESVADFIKRRLGVMFNERFMRPMTAGIYASTPESLSINAAFPKIANLEKEFGGMFKGMMKKKKGGTPAGELTSFEYGMSEMIDKLASYVNVIKKEIQSLDEVEGYDKVILSTPAYNASDIVKTKHPQLAHYLRQIEYVPVAIVGFSGDVNPKGFGILTTKSNTLGVLMDKYIFPNRNGIRVMIGGKRFEKIKELSQEEIVKMVFDDLEQIIGPNDLKFEFFKMWNNAIPNYKVGHLAVVKDITQEMNKIPNLYLNSNAYKGVSFNDCVKNAKELAKNIKNEND